MASPPPQTSPNFSPVLSIRQLALTHCREKIFVTPLFWTNRQLELLRCSFSDAAPAAGPPTSTSSNGTGDGTAPQHNNTRTQENWRMADRAISILGLLADSNDPFIDRKDVRFYFNGRSRAILKCVLLLPRGDSDRPVPGAAPVVAFADHARLMALRSDVLSPNMLERRARNIAISLFKLRLKSITPKDPHHDPYIVALLIAVAQHQYIAALHQADTGQYEIGPLTFFPQVLFSSPDRDHVHHYTAEIPSSTLDQLNRPAVPPVEQISIPVQVTAIPYEPEGTLRARLFAAILPPRSQKREKQRHTQAKVPSTKQEAVEEDGTGWRPMKEAAVAACPSS
ncbi:hypothetical protein DCS_00969 [Drechmeria coniospora]|uniref:Uncharacterized protein n=1 Tax=Drechmeria coniospora TaxID=98403 RepID=A0A151GRU8_DRECN|nr:hypothetical protein DCS_00969 [Drechmeria coniospora]KYK59835.1 hypothetical protein DCS_00969 [Drechmeria coniospora]